MDDLLTRAIMETVMFCRSFYIIFASLECILLLPVLFFMIFCSYSVFDVIIQLRHGFHLKECDS